AKAVWPAANQVGNASERGMWAAGEVDRMIASAGSDALVVKRSYFSQSIDASPMEADHGNAWFDPSTGVPRLMMATQSPYEVAMASAAMVAASRIAVKSIDLSIGYT